MEDIPDLRHQFLQSQMIMRPGQVQTVPYVLHTKFTCILDICFGFPIPLPTNNSNRVYSDADQGRPSSRFQIHVKFLSSKFDLFFKFGSGPEKAYDN